MTDRPVDCSALPTNPIAVLGHLMGKGMTPEGMVLARAILDLRAKLVHLFPPGPAEGQGADADLQPEPPKPPPSPPPAPTS